MGCELLAEALRGREGLSPVALVCAGQALLDALRLHRPEVLLLSAALHEGPQAGLKLLRRLRIEFPQTAVIVLHDAYTRAAVVESFRSGAKGVFARSESWHTLTKCITTVRTGQVWANSENLHFLLEELFHSPQPSGDDNPGLRQLTARETQIMRLVAEGLTNQEIARHLAISVHTVKNCMFRIFNKLGVSSRVELARLVMNQSRRPDAVPSLNSGKPHTQIAYLASAS